MESCVKLDSGPHNFANTLICRLRRFLFDLGPGDPFSSSIGISADGKTIGVTLSIVFAISGDGSAMVGMWTDTKSNVGTWIAYLPPNTQNLLTK